MDAHRHGCIDWGVFLDETVKLEPTLDVRAILVDLKAHSAIAAPVRTEVPRGSIGVPQWLGRRWVLLVEKARARATLRSVDWQAWGEKKGGKGRLCQ